MRIGRFELRGPLCLALAAGVALAGCETQELNPPPPDQIRADAGTVVDAREIVALVPSRPAADRLRSAAAGQGFVLRELSPLSGLDMWMVRFQIPEPLDGPGAIAALETIEPTATAGVNHAYTVAAATGTDRFDYATALMDWPAGGCPAHGPIGMLDTGVDASLAARSGADIVTHSFARGTPGPDAHGTEVASILVDPRRLHDVTLYSAGVIARSARGREEAGVDSILKALDWMAEEGVRVVNVSLAGPYNKLLDRGVDRAVAKGMTIVAAVGNDGADGAPRYPAALGNVIAVTAVDADGQIYRKAVRGPYVDVAAPGVDIYAAGRFVSGTSMAVPFVTARIAADPDLYPAPTASIRKQLSASARDLGLPGRDTVYGAGLVLAKPGC
ncbi:Subtilisin DY [Marinibacterium anthonyi]|nr:Subtilisin DY [Marinibacterium anthonyi]